MPYHQLRAAVSVGLSVAIASLTLPSMSRGQVVWSGLTYQFDHPAFSDAQDVISPNVTLTRGSSRGLFNAAYESGFLDNYSPEWTYWATSVNNPPQASITATNWQNLNFDDWQTAYGGGGALASNIVGMNAVLYLELDDTDGIYLDIQFTSWGQGPGAGGEFSYLRAVPPSAGPTGDYNGNGFVDAADYTIWRDTLGSMDDLRANGDDSGLSEGVIDQADYTFWKTHFGDAVPTGAGGQSTVVPEPSTVVLLLGGMLMLVSLSKVSRCGPGQDPF